MKLLRLIGMGLFVGYIYNAMKSKRKEENIKTTPENNPPTPQNPE